MSPLARAELGHPEMPWRKLAEGAIVVVFAVAVLAITFAYNVSAGRV